MKDRKKDIVLIGAGIVLAALLVYIGVNIMPKNRMIKEIAKALHPILESENQSMHMNMNTEIGEEVFQTDADIYMVQEDSRNYFVAEWQDFPIYVTDNILLFENGKAFKIADNTQKQAMDYKSLFSHISTLYKVLDIICEKSDLEKSYLVEVTDEKMEELLAMLPIENEYLENIEKLQMKLVTRDKKLNRIEFKGSTDAYEKEMELTVLFSDFRVLAEGEYGIPDAVKESAETVDADSLFSLSEDLYRLMKAAKKISHKENIDGTVYIAANCGKLRISTQSTLKEFQSGSGNANISMNPAGISDLMSLLCLEGDISCSEEGDESVYLLQLSEETMQVLAERLVPELVNYVMTFTKGSAEIVLKEENISSAEIEIGGNVKVLTADIPANVSAEIQFWED